MTTKHIIAIMKHHVWLYPLNNSIAQPQNLSLYTMQLRLHAPFIVATLFVGLRGLLVSAFAAIQLGNTCSSRSWQSHRMFTGIVEEMGVVVSLEEREDMTLWDGSQGKGTELVVQGNVVMEGAYLG